MPLLGEVRYKQGKIAGLMENASRDLKVDASKITLADDIIGSAGFSGKDYTRNDVMKVLNIALGRRKADIAGFQISNELEGLVQVTLDTTLNYKQRFNERRLLSWCEQLFPTGYSGLIKMEAGKYRNHEMQAVTGTPGEEEKIHYEAPAPERIQSEMNRFFDWFNTPGTRPFDNMLRAGVAYFWILTIHPFEDGNGRVARAVSDLLLARSDNSTYRYYSPNITLRFERDRYYSCLEEAQNGDGDLTRWLTYYLQSVRDSMWEKCEQYLKKIGGVILIASIVVWFLSYYPRLKPSQVPVNATSTKMQASSGLSEESPAFVRAQYEQSFLGRIGKFFGPTMKPLGLDWRASVALISGMPAKEIIVSTLGVLYKGGASTSTGTLAERLRDSGDMTPRSALALLVFILLYFPCIATLAAIANETGKWYYAVFSAVYNTLLAWVVAFAIYNLASSQNWQTAAVIIIGILVLLSIFGSIRRKRKSPCCNCVSAANCAFLRSQGPIDPNDREWMIHRKRYGPGTDACPRVQKK